MCNGDVESSSYTSEMKGNVSYSYISGNIISPKSFITSFIYDETVKCNRMMVINRGCNSIDIEAILSVDTNARKIGK